MNKLELTSEQKHEISAELNASDFYETVPFLNHVLKVLGYSDYMEDDREREELRWTKREEPLIKDEKIRKAVRAWAEANEVVKAFVVMNEHMNWTIHGDDVDRNRFRIEFFDRVVPENDETKNYTIAELCGEEEE